jgi:hypothetical protein
MTEARSKSESLSATTKSYLRDTFIKVRFGRTQDLSNKYLIKGIAVEDDSITLLSMHMREMLTKNEAKLTNDYLSGTPDLIHGDVVIDIKSRWDIYSYFKTIDEPMDKMNYWQLVGYMELTGCNKAKIVNTLVNTPFEQIQSELKREQYQWSNSVPAWREIEIIKNLVYDFETFDRYVNMVTTVQSDDDKKMFDSFVEVNGRVNIVEIQRNDKDVEDLYNRIFESRIYLNSLCNKFSN